MKKFLFILLLMPFFLFGQQLADLDKPYNEVTFIGTHNAYNTQSEKFRLPNQDMSVYQQLSAGARALCLDIYAMDDTLYQMHRYPMLRTQKLADDFLEIRDFLEEDTSSIVTLLLECYVRTGQIDTLLREVGLSSYLFEKQSGQSWPTCQELIKNNSRLIIFGSCEKSEEYSWNYYDSRYLTSTDYSNFRKGALSTDIRGKDTLLDLLIMNHFVYDWFGTGSKYWAKRINTNEFVRERCLEMKERYGKFPNFVLVDHFREGILDLEAILKED